MVTGGQLFGCGRPAVNWAWARRSAIVVAALCGCVAVGGDRTRAAAQIDSLIAALAPSDGDTCSIETTRDPDGRTKVIVRGGAYDGRRLLRAVFAGLIADDPQNAVFDVDLDIKVAAFAGFGGEPLRDVALQLSGRGGEILTFAMSAKLGDADLSGELRDGSNGRRVIFLEATDAGAFFRFIDVYRHLERGRAWIALDRPRSDHAAQGGTLNVRDFTIAGEPALKSVGMLAHTKAQADEPIKLSRLRIDFEVSADQLVVRDGLVVGPLFGAQAAGKIDIVNNEVRLRGTALPFFALNQGAFGPSLPYEREGLSALSFLVGGTTQAPTLIINPATPLAPGLLRRLLELAPDAK